MIQLQDTDAGAEVIHLAENGFCADGDQEALVADGALEIDGPLPVNTDGGLIANGEPIGASGLRQVHEVVLQLRGQAGDRQVPGQPEGRATRSSTARPAPPASRSSPREPGRELPMDTRDTRRSRPSSGARPASWRASSGRRPSPISTTRRAKRLRPRRARRRLARAARRRGATGDRSPAGSRPRSSPMRSADRSPTSPSPGRSWRATSLGARAREGGAAVVALSPALCDAAVVSRAVTSERADAVDVAMTPTSRWPTSWWPRARATGWRGTALEHAPGAANGVDLTRAIRPIPPGTSVRNVADQRRLITDDDLAEWTALGLALTSADLVGVMRGVLDVTVAYAAERRQYGVPVGSFQAVQHLLAEARCLMEGSLSVALHASWAVDNLPPDEALAAGRVAKAYCARAARTVCETAVQVHGGIGNTWECIVHVYLRRALLSSQWFGDDASSSASCNASDWGDRWTFVTRPPKPSSAPGCGRGSPRTTPACRRRRPTTSTGPARPSGTPRSTTPASSG